MDNSEEPVPVGKMWDTPISLEPVIDLSKVGGSLVYADDASVTFLCSSQGTWGFYRSEDGGKTAKLQTQFFAPVGVSAWAVWKDRIYFSFPQSAEVGLNSVSALCCYDTEAGTVRELRTDPNKTSSLLVFGDRLVLCHVMINRNQNGREVISFLELYNPETDKTEAVSSSLSRTVSDDGKEIGGYHEAIAVDGETLYCLIDEMREDGYTGKLYRMNEKLEPEELLDTADLWEQVLSVGEPYWTQPGGLYISGNTIFCQTDVAEALAEFQDGQVGELIWLSELVGGTTSSLRPADGEGKSRKIFYHFGGCREGERLFRLSEDGRLEALADLFPDWMYGGMYETDSCVWVRLYRYGSDEKHRVERVNKELLVPLLP